MLPVITLLYQYTGLGLFEITIISNVYTAGMFIFELPTSVLADTTGRKLSMQISVVCNLVGTILILLFPSYIGFILASFVAALYLSFWSGTGQAFLDENLRALGRGHEYGQVIGGFMFYEQLGNLLTPVVASIILYVFGSFGFTILAGLDVISAVILVILVLKLHETSVYTKFISLRAAIRENVAVAKEAVMTVCRNKKIRLIMMYRTLTHHAGYLPLILLPLLTTGGMPEWLAGGVVVAGTVASMITHKYAYKLAVRFSYARLWVGATTATAIFLMISALTISHWVLLIISSTVFLAADGLRQPAWNHVLVRATEGRAVATIRSLVVSVFALYITVGKQIVVIFPPSWALAGIGMVILLVNVFLGKKVAALRD